MKKRSLPLKVIIIITIILSLAFGKLSEAGPPVGPSLEITSIGDNGAGTVQAGLLYYAAWNITGAGIAGVQLRLKTYNPMGPSQIIDLGCGCIPATESGTWWRAPDSFAEQTEVFLEARIVPPR